MAKAIRLRAYQNMVNYRRPSSIAIQDSYQLPPYSTVIGMIHNVCNFTEYHPMKIAISGRSATSITDMYTRYFFGMKLDFSRHQLYTETEGDDLGGYTSSLGKDATKKGRRGITRSLGYCELLVDMELIIHIIPEREEDFEIIIKGLQQPSVFPALGRHEDILRIDEVQAVELREVYIDSDEGDGIKIAYDTLIPMSTYNENKYEHQGTIVTYNKVFNTKNKKGKPLAIRKITERVKAMIIKADDASLSGRLYYDDLGNNEKVGVFPI